MLSCCSNICDKRFQCARYNTPVGEVRYTENLHNFSSGSMDSEGCVIDYWCGKYGNYRMFLPIGGTCT